MKKTLLAGFLCLLMANPFIIAQEMVFTETEHDFGQIKESDGDIGYDFHFTNTGTSPLVIKQVISGCGCTSAEWNKTPYQAGEEGIIRIIYHPAGRVNERFNIVTEVFINSNEIITLTVTGSVITMAHPYPMHFDPTKGIKKSPSIKQPKDDFELILQRVCQDLYKSVSISEIDSIANHLTKSMKAEGTWDDIDYKCFFRTNWEPNEHLERIKQMAIAYTHPQSMLYGNSILFQAIEQGLKAWNFQKPTSYNWWYNQIAAPQASANILALMEYGEEKLDTVIKEGIMQPMKQSDPRKWTGANKQDIAIHHLIRGCVLKSDSIVSTNAKEFFYPIRITDKEGIREDMSYQQHGPQLYIGGYGIVFVNNIAYTAGLFNGTNYALPKKQLHLFSDFVRHTYINVFRANYMDFSVCGRSISRENTLDMGNYEKLFQKMQDLDSDHAQEYKDMAERFARHDATIGRTDVNQLFYTSDYMLHNRKKYDFSVRAVSTRTYRSESGNGENLWGTYVSEGATNIRVFGDEYLDIFPVWEWDKIPGTTTPKGEVKNPNDWGKPGNVAFVGGVSEGLYGAFTYAMNDYGITANKAWFMFDKEIVCLGSNINSSIDKPIHTTVNQCHLRGDILFNHDIDKPFKGFIWHHHIGYYFPEETKIKLKNEEQKGSWAKINFNQSDKKLSMPIFNLSINHEIKPKNGRYAYIIIPGISNEEIKRYQPAIQIVSNTAEIQAVIHKELDILQAVFYQAGSITCSDKIIKVTTPCVVMIKNVHQKKPQIFIKDPTQKEELDIEKVVSIKQLKSY